MNRLTLVFLTAFTAVLSGILTGCSDRDTGNEPASPAASQAAGKTTDAAHAGSGDVQMDHESPEETHGAGGHDQDTTHEEQEGMAHEHGEHAGMQGASHWNAAAGAATLKNPVTADPASVQRGRDLFMSNCSSCHGESGRGDGPASIALTPRPANLVAMAPMHPAGDFFWKIANGRGSMPAWKNTLRENQIWDLVNYIKSTGETESAEDESSETGGEESDGHDHAH